MFDIVMLGLGVGSFALLIGYTYLCNKLWVSLCPLEVILGGVVVASLVDKKAVPSSSGAFPTDNGLFVGLLVGIILIVGGLAFFPVLLLGPVVEQMMMNAGVLF